MNYLQFRSALYNATIFSIKEVFKCFHGLDTRRLVEWQKKGYIKKLVNKWYIFNDVARSELLLYRISNCLHRPSYISLESALAYYHIIPESVFTIQAITTKKPQLLNTPEGSYNYRNVKPSLFFGYTVVRENELPVLIAEKEKAILDYLYLHPAIGSVSDIDGLRWNKDELQDIDWDTFDDYASLFKSKALNNRIDLLKIFFGK